MEGKSSITTIAAMNQLGQTPDSSSSSRRTPTKRSTKSAGVGVAPSKFKGVVSQPNRHWGAQIYANHQRIWLGTFKTENEAAMAYDSAAIKLRNGFTNRNIQCTDLTVSEPRFQKQFSTETVLAMIKDGSYASKFSDYLRADDWKGYSLGFAAVHDAPGTRMRELFQKELTPSDVSKLNRLVIPKKYALKFFPRIADGKARTAGKEDDLELVFFDRAMRSWNFRYCHWKSSQSYVFTRGWNRFSKEKGLSAKDRVIFSSYEYNGQKVCVLDVAYSKKDPIPPGDEGNDDYEEELMRVKMEPTFESDEMDVDGYAGMNEKKSGGAAEKKGFRLFGVQII